MSRKRGAPLSLRHRLGITTVDSSALPSTPHPCRTVLNGTTTRSRCASSSECSPAKQRGDTRQKQLATCRPVHHLSSDTPATRVAALHVRQAPRTPLRELDRPNHAAPAAVQSHRLQVRSTPTTVGLRTAPPRANWGRPKTTSRWGADANRSRATASMPVIDGRASGSRRPWFVRSARAALAGVAGVTLGNRRRRVWAGPSTTTWWPASAPLRRPVRNGIAAGPLAAPLAAQRQGVLRKRRWSRHQFLDPITRFQQPSRPWTAISDEGLWLVRFLVGTCGWQ